MEAGRISRRKQEHLEIGVTKSAVASTDPHWNEVRLIPQSLPEFSLTDLDLSLEFLGKRLDAPIVISGMTGGHDDALEINRILAAAAERLGIAMGVGSQRAALQDPSLVATYSVAREYAPSALLIGNLGMSQLVPQGDQPPFTSQSIIDAVEMIHADALAVHLNVIEEMIQPEGDRNTSGVLEGIRDVVESCPVPVIAKETGAGMSRETGEALAGVGIAALDVGGKGGTSFALIEAVRAARQGDERGRRLGETFSSWGLSTVISLLETRDLRIPLIATGGVRNGLHAAKAFALGASLVGVGSVALRAAQRGLEPLVDELELFIEELRLAMLLCGARTPHALAEIAPVLTGLPEAWVVQRRAPWNQ